MIPLTIENRTGKLKLNDGVHKESADKLIDELDKLYGRAAVDAKMVIGDAVCSADDALESIEVEINSPGGSVMEGNRIYNALRGMAARGVEVVTTVNGLAASMGSVILMAGDKRQMTHGSRIMIHEASMIAWGDARTLKKNSELLEGISNEIAGIYAERTGGDAKKIRNLMLAETWMTADEAKENGFVHSVIKDGKAVAEFDSHAKGMKGILSKLFPGNEEAEKIEAAIAESDSLRAELEAAQTKIVELTSLTEANAALQTELAEVQAKLADADKLANENAQTIADLTEKAAVTEEKVSAKAAELLAANGHPTPLPLAADDNKGPVDHLQIVASLKGEERTAYYNKHESEIKKQLTQASN